MKYDGITWGPSMRGYIAENKLRIGRCEASLASLKNQDGQFADDHRKLLAVYRDIEAVLMKHIEMADAGETTPNLPGHAETISGLSSLTIRPSTQPPAHHPMTKDTDQ